MSTPGPRRFAGVDPRLGLAWGVGRLAPSAMVNSFSLLLLFYLVSVAGMNAGVAGLMVFSARMFDLIASPTVGVLSDGHRSRWGRRRPFLLLGGVLGAAAFLLTFNVPHGLTQALKAVYVQGALLLYTAAYATINIPHVSMPNEMSDDSRVRVSMMSYGAAFTTLGGLLAGAVGPLVIQRFHGGQTGYSWLSVFMAAAVLVSTGLCCFGVRKAPFSDRRERMTDLLGSLRQLKDAPSFLVLTGGRFVCMLLVAGQTSTLIFFTRVVLKLPLSAVSLATVASTAVQLAALPGMVWLARRVGNFRTFVFFAVAGAAVASSWLLASERDGLAVFIVRYIAYGLVANGSIMNAMAMVTDTIEHDQTVTGRRREGMFSAIYSFAEKSSAAGGVLLAGMLLSASGFISGPAAGQAEPPHAILALYIAMGVLPACGFLGMLGVMLAGYRLRTHGKADPLPA